MAVVENRFVCDLKRPVQAQALKGNVFSLDNLGSRLSVLIYNNGQPATISGSVTANCILPDGSTVNVNGGLTTENGGSKAYVDIPQSCLLIHGILKIAIKCTSSSVITTLAAIVANVYMTKTDNVITPSQQIIDDWNAEISAALATIGTVPTGKTVVGLIDEEATLRADADNNLLSAVQTEATARTNADNDLKSVFNSDNNIITKIGDDFYTYERQAYASIGGGYALAGNGLCVAASGYSLCKFAVTEGDILLFENNGTIPSQYASFQFQSVAAVYTTGTPSTIGGVSFLERALVTVPEGATYLITTINNTDQRVSVYKLKTTKYVQSIVNLFNKDDVVGGYLTNEGEVYNPSGNAYKTSQFIDVTGLTKLNLSGTSIACWYDSTKTFKSMVTGMASENNDETTTIPDGIQYIRVSVTDSRLSWAQVGIGLTRDKYQPYSSFSLDGLVIYSSHVIDDSSHGQGEDVITVNPDGTGDYTSLTEALYAHVSEEKTIEVYPGTYDIIAEYKAKFGTDTFVNMGNSTDLNGFQNGIVLRKKKIHFKPGSKVVCDWTNSGHNSSVSSNFSPFRVDYDVEIEGLYLICDGVYYGIHDDYGITTPYTVKYKNCAIIGTNIRNVNCIGGGCKKYSRHILEDCYFSNGESAQSDIVLSCCVRYHNTNAEGAVPEVYVSNCYFETNFNACYYGAQETKMRVYVNNCFAPKGINKVRESSTMNTDNVDMFAWNNRTE
jgi:hypothetical protein